MKEFSYPQFCGKEKKLKEFSAFLLEKNAQFNLTAAKSEEELEIKHLLDSVLGAEFIPHGAKCADIGSGGRISRGAARDNKGRYKLYANRSHL